jgi:hypothetical protein
MGVQIVCLFFFLFARMNLDSGSFLLIMTPSKHTYGSKVSRASFTTLFVWRSGMVSEKTYVAQH